MPPYRQLRPLVRYLIAVVASTAALSLIGVVEGDVGFMPLLLLPAVSLVERYAGPGPAIITTILCTFGSLHLINLQPTVHARIHNVTQLGLFPAVALSVVYLMEARRQQKRLAYEQTLELSTLLESMPEAVFIFSEDGRVVNANLPAEELCACGRGGLLGRYFTEIAAHLNLQHDERPIPPGEMAVARALRGETVLGESRTLISPNHPEPMIVVVSASAMRAGDGRVIGAVLVLRDLTEITHLQQRIADTERHLAIGQMASGIAHDFNNVLNTITQAVALLDMDAECPVPERRRYLGMIDRAARTGAEIIKRVREYIRGGTGQRCPVDVSDLVRQALDLTEPMWRKRPQIGVVTDLRPVPSVEANGPDLQRVFANLIINAIQAMPEGGTLTLETAAHDGAVLVRVHDTGIGIPPEQQKSIFLPYYTTKPQGTGLGLSTAQRTVLAQGGNIAFTSEVGKGTVFTISLPAIKQSEGVAA